MACSRLDFSLRRPESALPNKASSMHSAEFDGLFVAFLNPKDLTFDHASIFAVGHSGLMSLLIEIILELQQIVEEIWCHVTVPKISGSLTVILTAEREARGPASQKSLLLFKAAVDSLHRLLALSRDF